MRADYIKPSVYTRIYHLMMYENAIALRLSLETGMRIGDCLSLTRDNINGQRIEFIAQKTGKRGVKKISADLSKRLMKIAGKKYIFEGRNGDKPRTRQAVWKDVKKCALELGINENMSVHSARKTYAVTELHEKGFADVQKELQHERAETTMLYAYSDILFGNHGSNDYNELMKIAVEIRDNITQLRARLQRIEKLLIDI